MRVSADETDPNEPPLVGQPEDFSGAVGVYSITCRVTPTEVVVEEPITLTVIITGTGPKKYRPERAKLHLFPPEMKENFYLEPLPEQDRHVEGLWGGVWEFVYRLRPKRADIKRTPELRFVYYNPRLRNDQPYLAARVRGLPIRVTPAVPAVLSKPKEATRILQAPERFYELATGETVLARSGHAGDKHPFLVVCLLLAPPVICAAWYVLVRRLHPDAGWRARRRRSRAARAALAALQAPGKQPVGEYTAFVLASYLRQRLELSGAEPTPTEIAVHLGRAGISFDVSRRVAEFFRTCDAARFASSPVVETANLTADARALVQALEAELCTSQAC